MDPVAVKPGYLTTEFWMTAVASLIGLLVAVGVIGQDDVQNVNDALANAIKSVGGFVASAAMLWKYVQSRGEVKSMQNAAIVSSNDAKLAALGPNASRLTTTMLLIGFFCCSTMFAADINLLKKGDKYYLVDKENPANPNKEVTVVITDLGATGPVVIPPVVVVPTPVGDLSAVIKTALAGVPAYADKEQDQRVMAFTLNLLSSAVAKAPDATKAQGLVRAGCDVAVGANKDKWVAFWAVVDAKLAVTSATPVDTYAGALKTISDALVTDLPLADEKDGKGERTFGLNLAKILELFQKLLPIIELIIKGFTSSTAMILRLLI